MKRLLRDQRGISSVEFVIVMVVFFMCVFGVIDFARAMWEWNAAQKATQRAVRYAVVNDMVSIPMRSFNCLAGGGVSGTKVGLGTTGTESQTCTNTGCNGDGAALDAIAFTNIVTVMQRIYPRIQVDNVVIEYEHIDEDLSFCGLNAIGLGPDISPAITVKLQNMTFDFITPGLAGIVSIDMPDFAATMTGEDNRSS